jgi:hypothetical protein
MKLEIEIKSNGIHQYKYLKLIGVLTKDELQETINDLKSIAKYNDENIKQA